MTVKHLRAVYKHKLASKKKKTKFFYCVYNFPCRVMSGESTGLPDVRRPECHIAFSSSTTTLPSEGSSEGSLSLLAWKCVEKPWMAWTRSKKLKSWNRIRLSWICPWREWTAWMGRGNETDLPWSSDSPKYTARGSSPRPAWAARRSEGSSGKDGRPDGPRIGYLGVRLSHLLIFLF